MMVTTLRHRARQVLGRFPYHWHAVDENKLLAHVVASVAGQLDIASAQLGRVRQAHRLGQADEHRDALLLAGLHGLSLFHFSLLRRRLDAFAFAAEELLAETEPEAAVERLAQLLAVPRAAFAPAPTDPSSDVEFRQRLANAIQNTLSLAHELDAMREQVRAIVAVHRGGNATCDHILRAAALYLHLDVQTVSHSQDRYWHLAQCRDRFSLKVPALEPGADEEAQLTGDYLFASTGEYLAIEENPFEDAIREPVERKDADRFTVSRHGFDTVPARVHIIGIEDRCWGPMIVNLRAGTGIWFQANVPNGQELILDANGRATLDDEDVTEFAWSFRGGLYAAKEPRDSAIDFVFGDANADENSQPERVATFATSRPGNIEPDDDAFEPEHSIPHSAGVFEPAALEVGTSRWAFFIQRAHFGARRGEPPVDEPAVHLYHAGYFDHSVLNPSNEPVASVGFSWRERQAFAMTLWIPERFRLLDDGVQHNLAEPSVAITLERLLTRHRALGIRLRVDYATDHWNLGEGVLRDADSSEAIGTALVGTRTWPDGTGQPPAP